MHIIKKNKRAQFDFFIYKRFIAGIVLTGPEVKAIKAGGITISESYVRLKGEQLFLWNAVVTKSIYGALTESRERKLLLHKKEMIELKRESEQRGLTIIPTVIGLEHGLIKIEIAVAKGKKKYDKRESIKERESGIMLRRKLLKKYK